MKVQHVINIINAAEAEAKAEEVKPAIYKPRKGHKIIQVKYNPGFIPAVDPDKDERILGVGYFWNEHGELEKCYALEVPSDVAAPINRDFENAKGEFRRAHRHKIWNKKHTKKIMCPFTNSCSKCPFADHPEEIFPSEAEEHTEVSYDEVNQDRISVKPESFGSAESMDLGIEMEEMMEKLKSLEDQTLYILGTLLNLQYEYKEIQQYLKLDDDNMEAYAHKYITYYRKYID